MSNIFEASSVILDTILGRLALLFLTGAAGDLNDARQAARQMLDAYHPQTTDELCLAAEIISFSFHALDALSQSADPALSLNQKLRLRGSAVSLSRESHKSQRKLDQLQKARRAGSAAVTDKTSAPRLEPRRPAINGAAAPLEAPRNARTPVRNGTETPSLGYQQHQPAMRIAENLMERSAHLRTAAIDPGAALAG